MVRSRVQRANDRPGRSTSWATSDSDIETDSVSGTQPARNRTSESLGQRAAGSCAKSRSPSKCNMAESPTLARFVSNGTLPHLSSRGHAKRELKDKPRRHRGTEEAQRRNALIFSVLPLCLCASVVCLSGRGRGPILDAARLDGLHSLKPRMPVLHGESNMKRLALLCLVLLLTVTSLLIADKPDQEARGVKVNGHTFTLPDGFEIDLVAGP